MSKAEKHLYPVTQDRLVGYYDYNEDWYVRTDGQMLDKRTGYVIPPDELDREHWLIHLLDKRWFDATTFLPAYIEACRKAGLEVIHIRIDF